jgi:hypothetical protein
MNFDVIQHEFERQTVQWDSYGKNGDEPLTKRIIKDISNDHLEHVIPFIERYRLTYGHDTLNLMVHEKEYRTEKNIFVPDYDTPKRKSFIRGLK